MVKMLGAAVAALVLSLVGSASAAVLYQGNGTISSGPEYHVGALAWPYNGTDNFRFQPLTIEINYSTNSQAPNLMGLMEYRLNHQWIGGGVDFSELQIPFALDGTTAFRDIFSITGSPGRLVATITPTMNPCPGWDGSDSCHWYEVRGFALVMLPQPGDTLTYDITISTLDTSAVPEPATWLMLIAGFGMAGAALRQRQAAMFRNSPI